MEARWSLKQMTAERAFPSLPDSHFVLVEHAKLRTTDLSPPNTFEEKDGTVYD
jgi:hypothetical protein